MKKVTIGKRTFVKSSMKREFENFRVLTDIGIPIANVEVLHCTTQTKEGTPLLIMKGTGANKEVFKDADGNPVPKCFITFKAQSAEQEQILRQALEDEDLALAYNQKLTLDMSVEKGLDALASGFGTLKLESSVRDDGTIAVYPARFIPSVAKSVTDYAKSRVNEAPQVIELPDPKAKAKKTGEEAVPTA